MQSYEYNQQHYSNRQPAMPMQQMPMQQLQPQQQQPQPQPQPQQHSHQPMRPGMISQHHVPPVNMVQYVKEVWETNLAAEFKVIRSLIERYPFVALTTEFVGTTARPVGAFRSKTDYHYQTMRANVDLLNPVQLGISLCDANGNKPENIHSTWQFNFKYRLAEEMYPEEGGQLLLKTGVMFQLQSEKGVDLKEFASRMIDSGLLLMPGVTWLSYHAGYDFGFLVSLVKNDLMPQSKEEFEWWVKKYLPNFYDLNLVNKVLTNNESNRFSLDGLAEDLQIPRLPLFVSTGGQALLTSIVFFNIQAKQDLAKYKGYLWGISSGSNA